MAQGQQYVAYQAAEAARELATRERGWAGRLGERIRGYESEARAAEVAGRSVEAAFNMAIAEKVRAYESQARAWQATSTASTQKWEAKKNLALQKSQLELQKGQMLLEAAWRVEQMASEEYWREYQSKYQATKDTYLAEQAADEAYERRRQAEWERERERIDLEIKKKMLLATELPSTGELTAPSPPEWATIETPPPTPTEPGAYAWQSGAGEGWQAALTYPGAGAGTAYSYPGKEPEYRYATGYLGGV